MPSVEAALGRAGLVGRPRPLVEPSPLVELNVELSPAAGSRTLGVVTAHASTPELLTLHAVRLLGVGDSVKVARRFSLDAELAGELLLDAEASGWVRRVDFAGLTGWTLTEAGRLTDERSLAAEIEQTGTVPLVAEVHADFLPLNDRLQAACTRWQIRPLPGAPLAANDHTDFRWDDRVLAQLRTLGGRLRPLNVRLAERVARFGGYADRFDRALERADKGRREWVDGVGVDSCHRVWLELHEDLIATLGIERGGNAGS